MMGWGKVDQNCLKAFFDLSGLLWEEVYTRSLYSALFEPTERDRDNQVSSVTFWHKNKRILTLLYDNST